MLKYIFTIIISVFIGMYIGISVTIDTYKEKSLYKSIKEIKETFGTGIPIKGEKTIPVNAIFIDGKIDRIKTPSK